MLGKLFLVIAATVGGIYLSSPEGKNARIALMRRKAAFEPLVRDLLNQVKEVLSDSQQLDSVALRANIDRVMKEVKVTLNNIDFDAALEVVREALRVTARKIREAELEVQSARNKSASQTRTTNSKTLTSKTKSLTKTQAVKTSTHALNATKEISGKRRK